MSFALLLNNLTITTGNFVMHRSLYEEIGPFAPYVTCHDWDYVLRVILHEEPLHVPEELMDYRIHERNTLKEQVALVEQEGIEVRRAYLENVNDAKNPLAPGPMAWGPYWDFFINHYLLPALIPLKSDLTVNDLGVFKGVSFNPNVYELVVEAFSRHVKWSESLENEVSQLSAEVSYLRSRVKSLEEQLRAPLYFAIRRRLLPWYTSIGGENIRLLTWLKEFLKRILGLR